MKIYLMRHATSIGNEKKMLDSRLDYGLSEDGKKEARELVPKLREHKFDVFIASPLKRTQETLAPLLETLKNPKLIISDLTLERDGGIFTGQNQDAIKEYCEKNNIDKVSFKPPKGESIVEVYERAKKFVNWLKENFKNESVLICSHKNFLMSLEIVLTNKSIKNYYSYESLKNGEIRTFELKIT